MNTKQELRTQILEYRDSLSDSDREYLDSRLKSRLLEMGAVKEAPVVLAYASYKSEADTKGIIKTLLEEGRKVALPKVEGNDMVFYLINGEEDLELGYKNIPEPKQGLDAYEPSGKDVLIVPGVCFDKMLFRIGYGKGFYDRYISEHKSIQSIGLAYDFQVVDAIPIDSWDRGLDIIVTEKGIITY